MENFDDKFDMKILSSSHLNFLFGSGVNGKAFPQFNGFKNTLNSLKKAGALSNNLEEALNEIKDEDKREKILETFQEELKESNKKNKVGRSVYNEYKKVVFVHQ